MKPLRIKNTRRRFSAARDDQGVPHIEASSFTDALYGLGVLHALDRPTQMLFGRVVAAGRSAETIADQPELFETDSLFRKVGLHLNLDREIGYFDDLSFAQLTAYCQGVNDGLTQSWRSLPMWATGFQPEPWNQQAALLIGNLLAFGGLAIGQQQNERLILELIHAGVDEDRLRELFGEVLAEADFELLRQVHISRQLSDEALELITDLPRLAGSNAWAVAPSRSATGSTMLAADPHLEVNRLPSIWYEAVLRWGDDYVMGATLPGCPLFAVARTRHVGWGVTYLRGDTSDFFIEDCRPVEGSDPPIIQYRRGDTWRDFECRVETIGRKGQGETQQRVYYNEVGTLDGDPLVDGPGYYLTWKWTGEEEGSGQAIVSWLELIECRSTRDAMDVIRDCPQPTLAWVIADRDGHIGWQANGRFPDRAPQHNGVVPLPAWDKRNHWRGLVSSTELPRIYDPPEGFVTAANVDCNPRRGVKMITVPVPDWRKRRIDEALAARPQVTLEEMQVLQYDVISTQARELLRIFLPHMPAGPIRDQLAAWDYNYAPESVEPNIFLRLYRNVLLEIFGQEPGDSGGIGWRRMFYLSSRAGYSTMVMECVDRLLHQEQSHWWRHRDKGEMIRRAAERLDGQAYPPWSMTNSFEFTNRFFEGRLVGRALGFHTGELPMPGCHATLFQGHLLRSATRESTFAPSYHFVTDLGQDEAWTNLPGGPSESRFSRWYRNDIPRWCAGEYKRLALE